MQLVEQHIIKQNSPFYKECDSLCFKTKNLYNSCLYVVRQAYIKDKVNLLYELHNLMKGTEQYKDLPTKVSSTVLLMVQKNFKSFFKGVDAFDIQRKSGTYKFAVIRTSSKSDAIFPKVKYATIPISS